MAVFSISSDPLYSLPAKSKERGTSKPRKSGVEVREGGTKKEKESQVDSVVDLRGTGMLKAPTPGCSNPLPRGKC